MSDTTKEPLLNAEEGKVNGIEEGLVADNRESVDLAAQAFKRSSTNELNIFNGVIVPCLLNILGVVLFLRLGWAIGEAGLGEALALLTVLSVSAIVTNGHMKGGGSYYMISRLLGPEFGGAIGVLFYFAYAIGCSFYTSGFATEIYNSFFTKYNEYGAKVIIGICALIFLFAVAMIGAKAYTKVNVILFVIQVSSIWLAITAMWFRKPHELENGGYYSGLKWDVFMNNSKAEYSQSDQCGGSVCDFKTIFGVIFPAVIGIMEGANLSGDLKDPRATVGKGTLIAVLSAIAHYVILILSFSASMDRTALRDNPNPFQDIIFNKYISIIGASTSTLSAALATLFGSSRILQALCRDNLFPIIKSIGKGYGSGDEPRRAIVCSFVVGVICILAGSFDVLAQVITGFFCLGYSLINLSCFLMRISGTPNFRPTFRCYGWPLSLAGAILGVALMYSLNIWYALFATGLWLVLFIYLIYTAPESPWGDIGQALIFHQVRKYLLRLDTKENHPKFWRPSVLLLADDASPPLLSFCNVVKKGGLYVVGNVIVGDFNENVKLSKDLKDAWNQYITKTHLKAFPTIVISNDARSGYRELIMCGGLGALNPNTIIIPFYEDPRKLQRNPTTGYYSDLVQMLSSEDQAKIVARNTFGSSDNFVGILRDSMKLDKHLLITRHFDSDIMWNFFGSRKQADNGLSDFGASPINKTLDVYIFGKWNWEIFNGSLSLMIQLAHISHSNSKYASTTFRLIEIVGQEEVHGKEEENLKLLIKETRIKATPKLVIATPDQITRASDNQDKTKISELSKTELNKLYNNIIMNQSNNSVLIFVKIDPPSDDVKDYEQYYKDLELLGNNLPPLCMVTTESNQAVITREI